jgi:hypothetical protein
VPAPWIGSSFLSYIAFTSEILLLQSFRTPIRDHELEAEACPSSRLSSNRSVLHRLLEKTLLKSASLARLKTGGSSVIMRKLMSHFSGRLKTSKQTPKQN